MQSFAALRTGSLDEAEYFLHNRDPSAATLRGCSRSSRNTVRTHPGIAFTLPRIPHLTALVCSRSLMGLAGV